MIVVRNTFRLKFGKAREAKEVMKEMLAINRRLSHAKDVRVLTDLTGAFYTLVLEMSFGAMGEVEGAMQATMGDAGWKAAYAKFVPLVESGRRDIYHVEE